MTAEPTSAEGNLIARYGNWAARTGLGRKFAIGLAIASLLSALATYAALAGWFRLAAHPHTILVLLNVNLVLFLLLGAVVARRLVAVWIARRSGSAGSRLHTRLVVMFSLVAVAPAIIVAVFSAVFFSLGMQQWFSDKVRSALTESLAVAEAYANEHHRAIQGDVLAMARDLSHELPLITENSARFNRLLAAQALIRTLTEAYVLDGSGRAMASWSQSYVLERSPVPPWAFDLARGGELVVLTQGEDDRVRALVRLDSLMDSYLFVSRYVEPGVLAHIDRTRNAVAQYESLEGRRSSFEITFAMIFALVALLLLLAAIWLGLNFATQLARPISGLVAVAERIRSGDLGARAEEGDERDEIGLLSRAFNRMTGQLEAQRAELVEANRQLENRRHFMETVLAGVSAGVIGLDREGRINLPNRSASSLLGLELDDMLGTRLADLVPDMAPLLSRAMARSDRLVEGQVVIQRAAQPRTLFVRIATDRAGGAAGGFVVTFDDVSDLMSAQRTAAWADVARRIAHEIKNPLTPIQLSAERLRRKYLREITSDPETFATCVETIVRQVGDIGRMVDEFSSFARMPAPVMHRENVLDIIRREVFLQRNAHPGIVYETLLPDGPVDLVCDRRQVGQMLNNLLKNAAEAVAARPEPADGALPPGLIVLRLTADPSAVTIEIEDNGPGWPAEHRERLTEPYVTTRAKGTGLGLAIVRKIMEDHGGVLHLDDRDGGGARVRLVFRAPPPDEGEAPATAAAAMEQV